MRWDFHRVGKAHACLQSAPLILIGYFCRFFFFWFSLWKQKMIPNWVLFQLSWICTCGFDLHQAFVVPAEEAVSLPDIDHDLVVCLNNQGFIEEKTTLLIGQRPSWSRGNLVWLNTCRNQWATLSLFKWNYFISKQELSGSNTPSKTFSELASRLKCPETDSSTHWSSKKIPSVINKPSLAGESRQDTSSFCQCHHQSPLFELIPEQVVHAGVQNSKKVEQKGSCIHDPHLCWQSVWWGCCLTQETLVSWELFSWKESR